MKRSGGAGLGLTLLSAAAFGTSGSFAASLFAAGWTPGAAVTSRVVLAAVVLTAPALLLLRGQGDALRRNGRNIAIYGVFAVAGCQLAFFNAVQTLSVAVALLLEYSGAVLVVGWMWWRHGHRPRALTVLGTALAILGLVLVLDVLGDAALDPVGVLWGLLAAVGLAVYYVLSAQDAGGLPPLVIAWGALAIGGVALLLAGVLGVLELKAPRTDVTLLDAEVSWLVPVLGLAVLAAAFAYVVGILGSRLLGAKVASFVGLTEVLFSVVFAFVLLDQSLTGVQIIGSVLVIFGIALVRYDDPVVGSSEPLEASLTPTTPVR